LLLFFFKKKEKPIPSPPPLDNSLPHRSDHSHQPVVLLHRIPHRLHPPLPPPRRPQIDQPGQAEMSREVTMVRCLYPQRNAEVVLHAIGLGDAITSPPSAPQRTGSHIRLFEPSFEWRQRHRALEVIDGGGGGAAGGSLVVCSRRLGESPEITLVEEVERVFSANRQCDGGDLGAVSLLILLLSGNLTYVERLVNPVWASWSRRRSLLVELGSLGESPEVALVVDVDGSGLGEGGSRGGVDQGTDVIVEVAHEAIN
jgi:hypothetical protein